MSAKNAEQLPYDAAWAYICPTRDEVMDIVRIASVYMRQSDRSRLLTVMTHAKQVAWDVDEFAGVKCPLRLASFTRDDNGNWRVPGAHQFEEYFDRAMRRLVMRGPGMVGIRG